MVFGEEEVGFSVAFAMLRSGHGIKRKHNETFYRLENNKMMADNGKKKYGITIICAADLLCRDWVCTVRPL